MRVAVVVSIGWAAVAAALVGAPAIAVFLVVVVVAFAVWPEACAIGGHRIRTLEVQDARLGWYWAPWRCVRCGRVTDDVRPEWAR